MNVNIKNYTVRGLSFAITGQQYSGRLPGGEYAIGEEMDLCYTDLGQARRGRAVELVNTKTGDKWYVGTAIAAELKAKARITKPIAEFKELELIDVSGHTDHWPTLIYDTIAQAAVCHCRSFAVAKSLLLASGYFRRPLKSGGMCWYCS